MMLAVAFVLMTAAPPLAQPAPVKADVEKAFAALQLKLAKNGLPNVEDKDAVKALFQEMFDIDQGARKTDPIDVDLMRRVDAHNRGVLREYLARIDWFRISAWGKEMDNRAWIIAQHADNDVAFQKDVLARLEKLVAAGETSGPSCAYLFDRVAVNSGGKQRYGTQGRCTGPGKWEPRDLEDPARVDELRKQSGITAGNGTLAEYAARMHKHCK